MSLASPLLKRATSAAFSASSSAAHRDLHSFPTRRSSDLAGEDPLLVGHRPALGRGGRERGPGGGLGVGRIPAQRDVLDRKSTRLNSSHMSISYAVFCLKKKNVFMI